MHKAEADGQLLQVGSRVRILRRSWLGTVGTVSGRDRSGKLRVRIAVAGAGTILHVGLAEIEPMEAAR